MTGLEKKKIKKQLQNNRLYFDYGEEWWILPAFDGVCPSFFTYPAEE
jgi:hypothetical protein